MAASLLAWRTPDMNEARRFLGDYDVMVGLIADKLEAVLEAGRRVPGEFDA